MAGTSPLDRLEADGLVRSTSDGFRTTARWQAAMARAALRLQRSDAPWRDVRLPIAASLIDLYRDLSDDELAALVEAMAPVELNVEGPRR